MLKNHEINNNIILIIISKTLNFAGNLNLQLRDRLHF